MLLCVGNSPFEVNLMTQEQIELISRLYEEGLSAAQLKQYVPYTEHTILKYLRKNGISIRSKAGYRKPFNEKYFDKIDTEKKAYFLGYMMADGNVGIREKSQPVVRLELKRCDKYILDIFREELDTDLEVKPSRKGCCVLRVHSSHLFNALNEYGVCPQKTGNEIFPVDKIPLSLIRHFIRGFFDGDGWLTITHHGKRKQCANLGFCGNENMLSDIRDYFEETLGCYHIKISLVSKGYTGFGNLIYGSKKDVKAICDYLYDEANIFLSRKKEKYDLFFHANIERIPDQESV